MVPKSLYNLVIISIALLSIFDISSAAPISFSSSQLIKRQGNGNGNGNGNIGSGYGNNTNENNTGNNNDDTGIDRSPVNIPKKNSPKKGSKDKKPKVAGKKKGDKKCDGIRVPKGYKPEINGLPEGFPLGPNWTQNLIDTVAPETRAKFDCIPYPDPNQIKKREGGNNNGNGNVGNGFGSNTNESNTGNNNVDSRIPKAAPYISPGTSSSTSSSSKVSPSNFPSKVSPSNLPSKVSQSIPPSTKTVPVPTSKQPKPNSSSKKGKPSATPTQKADKKCDGIRVPKGYRPLEAHRKVKKASKRKNKQKNQKHQLIPSRPAYINANSRYEFTLSPNWIQNIIDGVAPLTKLDFDCLPFSDFIPGYVPVPK
ncbi:hypothetical protein G9A89_002652 [Geosiphon pyriformis]|nr:hypothetical protein G9A89_002652 [Geosiphon pyriformis]